MFKKLTLLFALAFASLAQTKEIAFQNNVNQPIDVLALAMPKNICNAAPIYRFTIEKHSCKNLTTRTEDPLYIIAQFNPKSSLSKAKLEQS